MNSMQHLNDDMTKEQLAYFKRLIGQRISLNLVGKLVGVGRRAITVEIEEWDGGTKLVAPEALRTLVGTATKGG